MIYQYVCFEARGMQELEEELNRMGGIGYQAIEINFKELSCIRVIMEAAEEEEDGSCDDDDEEVEAIVPFLGVTQP